MPHKKRGHGHHKNTKEEDDSKKESQSSQPTPKPAAQVATVKPAQFEKSPTAMASKPGVTTATGGVAGGGSPSLTTKAKAETAPVSQVKAPATVHSSSAGAAGAASATTKPKESPKGPAKSATAITTIKAGGVQTKVEVEVPSAAAKGPAKAPSVDPFDALASILPSADSIVRPQPVYTGKVVTERNVISEKGVRCGERDDTLPPGYRFEDMGPAPLDIKPKDVPKPLSTDDALESLSFGFDSSAAAIQKPESKTSAGAPVLAVCPPAYPPTDRKGKMDDFSLAAGISPTPFTKASPPADKKAKMERVSSVKAPKVNTQAKSVDGGSISLDALSALSDSLAADTPRPEAPKLRPEDIVSEDKLKKEKGILVGEREDTLPPEYRFNKEELKKLPAPAPEPTISTGGALDFLSGSLTSSTAAPTQKAPPPGVAVCPPDRARMEGGVTASTATKVQSSNLPPSKKSAVPQSPASDALNALSGMLADDKPKPEAPKLRPEDIVSEDKHKKEKGVLVGERDDSIPEDYRFKVGDLKKLPALKPEPSLDSGDALDFLTGDLTAPRLAVCPPMEVPPPRLAVCPPMEVPPPRLAVCPPAVAPSAPPAQTVVDDLSALDALAGDFVPAPVKVSGVQAPIPPSTKKTPQAGSMSLDALDALCDSLPADVPKPELPKLRPEDIVQEGKHKKEKGVLVGERDDSIPEEYRLKEGDLKKLPVVTSPGIGTGDALDFLSGDLTSPGAPAVQTSVIKPSAPRAQTKIALDPLSPDFVPIPQQSKPVSCWAAEPRIKAPEPEIVKQETLPADCILFQQTCEPAACYAADPGMMAPPMPKPKMETLPADCVLKQQTIKPVVCYAAEPGRMAPPRPEPVLVKQQTLPADFVLFEQPCEPAACYAADPGMMAPPMPKLKTLDDQSALDALSGDFVAIRSPAQPIVCQGPPPAVCMPAQELAEGADSALDALSDTLEGIKPTQQPTAPVPTKDLVKEKQIEEERLIKMGERDDSLPPEYRPTEEDIKNTAEAKKKAAAEAKKNKLDDNAALDLLSSDFTIAPQPTEKAVCYGNESIKAPALEPMAGPVLDSLADTLIPPSLDAKPKTDKPKGKSKSKSRSKKHHAEEPPASSLPSAQSSDVVQTSTKKGGKR